MTDRNSRAEIGRLIEERIEISGDLVPALEAADMVETLGTSDPELLLLWLSENAVGIITQEIRRVLHVRRARGATGAARFADAARTYDQGGDPGGFVGTFAIRYRVDDKNTQRRVADMTPEDCEFVAGTYAMTAERAERYRLFHEALAREMRKRRARTISDMYSEEEYLKLLNSFMA